MYRYFFLIILQVTIILVARTSSLATCRENILRFSQTGEIEASTTEALIGESITVTCTSKCAWQWHKFTVNNEPVSADQSSPEGHQYSINSVSNSIANCPNCYIPSQQDCSDSSQGPVKSTLNMTFASSGVYYFQCQTSLYQFSSPYWPNNVIDVYSKILQIHIHDSSSPSAVTSMAVIPSSSVARVPAAAPLTSLMPSHTTTIPTTTPDPSNTAATTTSSPPLDPFVTLTVTVTNTPSFVAVTTVTITSSVTVSSSIRKPSESTSLSVDIGRASKDGCDSGAFSFTDTTVAIIILSVFCGLLLLTTVALAIALCCHTIKSPKGIEHCDSVMNIPKSSLSSVTSDSDTSSLANRIERMESSV